MQHSEWIRWRDAGIYEETFLSELAAALTRLRLSPVAHAAGRLHHTLLDNLACKPAMLQAPSAGDCEGALLVCNCHTHPARSIVRHLLDW